MGRPLTDRRQDREIRLVVLTAIGEGRASVPPLPLEFPHLSAQFRVRGVPHTVINRKNSFVGALPEPDFVTAVLEGAGVSIDEPHEAPSGPSTEIIG